MTIPDRHPKTIQLTTTQCWHCNAPFGVVDGHSYGGPSKDDLGSCPACDAIVQYDAFRVPQRPDRQLLVKRIRHGEDCECTSATVLTLMKHTLNRMDMEDGSYGNQGGLLGW